MKEKEIKQVKPNGTAGEFQSDSKLNLILTGSNLPEKIKEIKEKVTIQGFTTSQNQKKRQKLLKAEYGKNDWKLSQEYKLQKGDL